MQPRMCHRYWIGVSQLQHDPHYAGQDFKSICNKHKLIKPLLELWCLSILLYTDNKNCATSITWADLHFILSRCKKSIGCRFTYTDKIPNWAAYILSCHEMHSAMKPVSALCFHERCAKWPHWYGGKRAVYYLLKQSECGCEYVHLCNKCTWFKGYHLYVRCSRCIVNNKTIFFVLLVWLTGRLFFWFSISHWLDEQTECLT